MSAPPEDEMAPWTPNRGASAEAQCGTAPRAARDLTGEPCSPVIPFFLDGRFGLGEGASRTLGGVPGHISASGGQKSFRASAIFLWYRQAAPSLSKKEMVGPTVPRLEGGFPRPAARSRILPSQPAAGTAPTKQVVLGIQSLRPLRGQLPFHKGALQDAAAPRFPSGRFAAKKRNAASLRSIARKARFPSSGRKHRRPGAAGKEVKL